MVKGTSSREIIALLEQDGWFQVRSEGSHRHFRHAVKKGTVTVPHPRKDLPLGTVKNILKQAGIEV